MQKTYRPKKYANDALDPKDIIHGCNESAFNALFINNIKQTRREMSCFGSSNHFISPVRNTRKRKYVKRLGKEIMIEADCSNDTASKSTYLTPDKSIHVNKGQDLFDQLLNSSMTPKKPIYVKNDMFDQLLQREDPSCTNTSLSKSVIKNNNCSTDSEEDKKLKPVKKTKKKQRKKYSKNIKFKPHNETNLNDYDLIVEEEIKKQDRSDNSINRLEECSQKSENIKKLKDKSFNTPLINKYAINRLTQNIISLSPSTSTPVLKKYRSQSIYQYSPIKQEISVILDAAHDISLDIENKENKTNTTPVITEYKNNNTLNRESKQCFPLIEKCAKSIVENDSCHNTSIILGNAQFTCDNLSKNGSKNNTYKNVSSQKYIVNNNDSLKESTQKSCKNQNDSTSSNDLNNSTCYVYNQLNGSKNNIDRENQIEIIHSSILKKKESNSSPNSNVDLTVKSSHDKLMDKNNEMYSLSSSDESFLGFTCNSILIEENYLNNNSVDVCNVPDTPNNKCSRLSSDFQKESCSNTTVPTYENSKNISKDLFNSFESVNDRSVISVNIDKSNNQLTSADQTSFFDAHSHNLGVDNSFIMDLKKKCIDCQPIVQLEKLELLTTDREKETRSHSSSSISLKSNESANSYNGKEKSCINDLSSDYLLETSQLESITFQGKNSCYDHNSSSESNDKCISFVTTRKRNDVTNHSIIYYLNNSMLNDSSEIVNNTVVSIDGGINSVDPDRAQNDETNKNSKITEEAYTNHSINRVPKNHKISNLSKPSCIFDANDNSDLSSNEFINEEDISKNVEQVGEYVENNITLNSSRSEERKKESKNLTNSSKIMSHENIQIENKSHADTSFRPTIILQPGKRWERSLSIYKRMTLANDHFENSLLNDENLTNKGRKYRESIINTMDLQDQDAIYQDFQVRKSFWPTTTLLNDSNFSSTSLCKTKHEDICGFLKQDWDDTLSELSKLSIGSSDQDLTVIEKDSSVRAVTARDYVLRRCGQTDAILFDECYPDALLKNFCRKIGEGVYGEVFLWRARDGSVRVLKVIPVAGDIKVNGEPQKDFSEIISEIVIAMELSALCTPIAALERHFEDGNDITTLDLQSIENATDVFNEVIGVNCVYGSYPSRLLDLWDLYDECKGSENDNPAILPADQQFIVLELANAGEDLESFQFVNAEQAYALFIQIAFGLAVGEEAYQFEHRDLHWGNVLIAPTDQKWCTVVLRGRCHRVRRGGLRATVIDYSLSRLSTHNLRSHLPPAAALSPLYNDLAHDTALFAAHGDYQFDVYRLMQDKLGNEWKNFEPYTNILWLHYTVDKMVTALRYKRVDTKIHKLYINKLKGIKNRILNYQSSVDFVLNDNEIII